MHVKKTAILFFSILFLAFSSTVNANEAIITTDNLNVRTGPGTDFEQIDQVHTDEIYPILEEQNNWVKIQLEDGTGWVTTDYVKIRNTSESENTTTTNNKSPVKHITIQQDNTHLREGPSATYEISGFADKGTEFNVLSKESNWYRVENKEMSGYLLKEFVEKNKSSAEQGINNKKIVIDAGHGGRDVGAIGASGTYEKDFTFKTMQELKQELTALGAEVVLTRKNDEFISLASRTSLTNITDADAFISIHYNSVPSLPNVTGIGAYYYDESNQKLAEYVLQEVTKESGARNRGAVFGDFHVIRQNFKPSILVELGFISNLKKEQILQTNAYQKKLVTGIVNGLNKYFKNK
ncbi:N-acetylmuramoyl-L-alanine amidase [Virgibacillus doumboii]|uniref:N-acetylmuramoyl-L-alanine amidase n=1 Tax=Virgibacillus doumboii TaxID=2697503 RepID=UPI0013E05895|nr:N-acetylmuramoyl-L-alanine amidase [Virgibacillus doumboii]